MGIIDDELQEVKKLCEHVVPGSRLVSCVPSMVRVEIKYEFYNKNILFHAAQYYSNLGYSNITGRLSLRL